MGQAQNGRPAIKRTIIIRYFDTSNWANSDCYPISTSSAIFQQFDLTHLFPRLFFNSFLFASKVRTWFWCSILGRKVVMSRWADLGGHPGTSVSSWKVKFREREPVPWKVLWKCPRWLGKIFSIFLFGVSIPTKSSKTKKSINMLGSIFFSKVFIPTLSLANQFYKRNILSRASTNPHVATFKVSIAALVRDGLLRALTLAHQRCPQSRSVALSLCRVMGKVWGKGMGWVGTGDPWGKEDFFLVVVYGGFGSGSGGCFEFGFLNDFFPGMATLQSTGS